MVLRDIYNVVSETEQATFFAEMFSLYEIINVNTEAHYRYSGYKDYICLGGDHSELFTKDCILGLSVVGISALNGHVTIWVDG